MKSSPCKLAMAAVVSAMIFSAGAGQAAEKVGGVKVYKKQNTPRRVTSHRAYPLRRGGDTWLFSRTTRKAQHRAYVAYSKQRLPTYEGKRIDCADVALDNLLHFAKDKGLRVTFKVWKNGWRYIDSAQFGSFNTLVRFAKNYLGAHNVTDNSRLIRPLSRLTTPEAWAAKVKPGDLMMWSYNKPSRTNPQLPGRPTTVGHTQPIIEVQRGLDLGSTRLKVMNGDIQLSTGEALAARAGNVSVNSIKPVKGGCSLSNYPQYNGQLFHVLQKFNWNNPTGPQDPAQSGQGPLRWALFQ